MNLITDQDPGNEVFKIWQVFFFLLLFVCFGFCFVLMSYIFLLVNYRKLLEKNKQKDSY